MAVTKQEVLALPSAKFAGVSIDYDACIANGIIFPHPWLPGSWLLNPEDGAYTKVAAELAGIFLALRLVPEVIEVFNGSSRQASHEEVANAARNGNGLCIPAIKFIAEDFKKRYTLAASSSNPCRKVIFNPLLAADIAANLDAGTTIDLMERLVFPAILEVSETAAEVTGKQPFCPGDATKISLLYAQIHTLAAKHAEDELGVLVFCDDRLDILARLQAFFSAHPESLPANMQLCLLHRDECKKIPMQLYRETAIQGSGSVDHNYARTVRGLWQRYYALDTQEVKLPEEDGQIAAKLTELRQGAESSADVASKWPQYADLAQINNFVMALQLRQQALREQSVSDVADAATPATGEQVVGAGNGFGSMWLLRSMGGWASRASFASGGSLTSVIEADEVGEGANPAEEKPGRGI